MRNDVPLPAPRIALAVTNDLQTDQRVHKMCLALKQIGYEPIAVGIQSSGGQNAELQRPYPIKHLTLQHRRGAGFYAAYNWALLRWLLRTPLNAITANDLDTLPACYLAARYKQVPLIYDTHEYFTGVPELMRRPYVRAFWGTLERWLVPRTLHRLTVNQVIADRYLQELGCGFIPIYNVPYYREAPALHPHTPAVVLYQGALQQGRGLEALIQGFSMVSQPAELWIVGGGYLEAELKALATTLPSNNPIRFWGKQAFEKLNPITAQATLGVSLEDTSAPNSALSSPNKVYDYIQARVPILVTQRPELDALLAKYPVGISIPTATPETVSNALNYLLSDPELLSRYRQATEPAAKTLCWESQLPALEALYGQALAHKKA